MGKYKKRRTPTASPDKNPHLSGWKAEVQDLLDQHAGVRENGQTASNRTRQLTATVIHNGFNTLHEELGMRLQHPTNLREAHIRRLVQHWYYTEEKAVKTMTNELSTWRKFSGWIGKKGMVKSLPHYLPEVPEDELTVRTEGEKEKSWTTNGIDVQAKLDEAFRLNERFGLILLVQLTFGLRMREALCLRPWKADVGAGLNVYPGDGPKGGRPRFINYLVPEQKLVIEFVKSRVKKEHWLGWEFTRRGRLATLAQNKDEYYTRMEELGITKKKCGATGHGLRAEFSENMAAVKGFVPASKGGTGDQMPWDLLQSKLAEVSELLGHSRTSVMASYFRSFKRPKGATKAIYAGMGLASTSAKTAVQPVAEGSSAGDTVGKGADSTAGDTGQKADCQMLASDNTSATCSLAGGQQEPGKTEPGDERQLRLPLQMSST